MPASLHLCGMTAKLMESWRDTSQDESDILQPSFFNAALAFNCTGSKFVSLINIKR